LTSDHVIPMEVEYQTHTNNKESDTKASTLNWDHQQDSYQSVETNLNTFHNDLINISHINSDATSFKVNDMEIDDALKPQIPTNNLHHTSDNETDQIVEKMDLNNYHELKRKKNIALWEKHFKNKSKSSTKSTQISEIGTSNQSQHAYIELDQLTFDAFIDKQAVEQDTDIKKIAFI
jgi:hypothetical protein